MNSEVKKVDVELLLKIVGTMYDWSGVSEDTPDDFEVIADGAGLSSVTLGDLKDASAILSNLKNLVDVSRDGILK